MRKLTLRRFILAAHSAMLCQLLSASVAFSDPANPGWTNMGEQKLVLDAGTPAGVPIFISPGQVLRINVMEVVEKDTKPGTTPEQEDDDQKEIQVRKTSGVKLLKGSTNDEFTSELSSGPFPGQMIITVDPSAQENGTFTLEFRLHDKREDDNRHDDWTTMKTLTFTVSAACPDDIQQVDWDDQTPDPPDDLPNGETRSGPGIATLQATGNPPAGRADWNGTLISEDIGAPIDVTPNKFIDGFPPNGTDTSSFTIGSHGVNKFKDQFAVRREVVVLKGDAATGERNGAYSRKQTYWCDLVSRVSYKYKITHTFSRQSATGYDAVKGTPAHVPD